MPSVMQIIRGVPAVGLKPVRQPRGGYLNPRSFKLTMLDDDPKPLNEVESVSPGLVGLAVDYLTRFETGSNVHDAFHVSFSGARLVGKADVAEGLGSQVTRGLSDETINAACRLANYDSAIRAGVGTAGSPYALPEPEDIFADAGTCENVRTMVRRGVAFFDAYGPVTHDGIGFPGGYTTWMDKGDGDFMTREAVWDFKTSKAKPTNKQTLQICVYWLLGLHSDYHEDYERVERIGFVNPRRGEVMTLEVASIPNETLRAIQKDVIRYDDDRIISFD